MFKFQYNWFSLRFSRFLFLLIFPLQVMAQAGSILPLVTQPSETKDYLNAMLPEGILKLPADERFIIWVELSLGRLKLLEQDENGGLTVVKDIPISIGKNGFGKEREGDKRTPIGVYHFTSFFKDSDLNDFYGLGAYPLNYPNALDRRLQRAGSGIWLHGLPKGVEQRPFLDSDGCVVIDNFNLEEMDKYIDTSLTHIVLTKNEIHWVPLEQLKRQSERLDSAFENWRHAWERNNNDLYLSFYAQEFNSFSKNKAQWDLYKRRVNESKSSIKVEVSQLSFFETPKMEGVVSIRYYQDYKSSNYNWSGWKEQLWQEQDNRWQIIYEGNG